MRAADRGARRPQDAIRSRSGRPRPPGAIRTGLRTSPPRPGRRGRLAAWPAHELRRVAEIRKGCASAHRSPASRRVDDRRSATDASVATWTDLEEDALFANPQDLLKHEQVARARDGEELGEPLDQPQHERFEEIHVSSDPPRGPSGFAMTRPPCNEGRPPVAAESYPKRLRRGPVPSPTRPIQRPFRGRKRRDVVEHPGARRSRAPKRPLSSSPGASVIVRLPRPRRGSDPRNLDQRRRTNRNRRAAADDAGRARLRRPDEAAPRAPRGKRPRTSRHPGGDRHKCARSRVRRSS